MSDSAASPPDPQDAIRASDADREAVVQHLQGAFAEGRLDLTELDERMAQVYAARTMGELKVFTRDLPASTAAAPTPTLPAPRPPSQPESAPPRRGHPLLYVLSPIVLVNIAVWGIASLASGHIVYFWPGWIMVAWVFGAFGGHRHNDNRRREYRRRQAEWDRYRRDRADWARRYQRR